MDLSLSRKKLGNMRLCEVATLFMFRRVDLSNHLVKAGTSSTCESDRLESSQTRINTGFSGEHDKFLSQVVPSWPPGTAPLV